jgi:serine/threonine protein kinase
LLGSFDVRSGCRMTGPRVGAKFGPYELSSLIGAGGMGEVYQAYDTVKDRLVALKLLRPELAVDPSFQEPGIKSGRPR